MYERSQCTLESVINCQVLIDQKQPVNKYRGIVICATGARWWNGLGAQKQL